MKNQRFLIICTSILSILAILLFFLPESLALVWHVRHGGRASIGKYAIPVPTLWVAREDGGSTNLIFVGMVGRFRGAYLRNSDWGMMQFSVVSDTAVAERRKAFPLIDERRGTQKTTLGTFQIGDQQIVCVQRGHPFLSDETEINCGTPLDVMGLSANFTGSAKSADLFLNTLRSVTVSSR